LGLLCLYCAVVTSPLGGQDTAAKVAANEGAAVGRSDRKIGHHSISQAAAGGCVRPGEGAEVPEPADLRSVDGFLKVDLAFRSYVTAQREKRYCYVTLNGEVSPTLRAKPGDTVILNFKNEAAGGSQALTGGAAGAASGTPEGTCANGAMKPASTNLHFHGLTVLAFSFLRLSFHFMGQAVRTLLSDGATALARSNIRNAKAWVMRRTGT
jgi:FtsP/CotA-like multicopper oxidase with cupredoxin domain